MEELNTNELEEISGGLIPAVAYGVYFGCAALGSFAASAGFAFGAVDAMNSQR